MSGNELMSALLWSTFTLIAGFALGTLASRSTMKLWQSLTESAQKRASDLSESKALEKEVRQMKEVMDSLDSNVGRVIALLAQTRQPEQNRPDHRAGAMPVNGEWGRGTTRLPKLVKPDS